MAPIPSDMVTVVDLSQQRFWVYYVDTEGTISILKGPEANTKEDAKNNPLYEGPKVISFGGPQSAKLGEANVKANPKAPKLAVCDYKPNGGVWEVRSMHC